MNINFDPDHPTPQDWSARLQEVIEATPGEVVLVGHSAGVPNVVHWARLYGGHERVRGTMLVSPTDADDADLQAQYPAIVPLAPVPMQPLPFPALVVYSENDPVVTPECAQAMAAAWGARAVSVGEAAHINLASGHGPWPEGEVLLFEVLHV